MTVVDDVTATSLAWLERDEAALAATLARATDVVAVEGRGSWLIDVDGRRWLDLASGIARDQRRSLPSPGGRGRRRARCRR